MQNPSDNYSINNGPANIELGRNLRVAVVDDEPLARRAIRRALNEIKNVDIVGESSSVDEAKKMLSTSHPDMIFLDVEMPGKSGLELAHQLNGKDCPYIVFVTAYDKYALDAFKVHAIDYVLKPISEEKIHEAVKRIAGWMRERYWQGIDTRLNSLIKMFEQQKKNDHPINAPDRFTIRNNGRIYFVETSIVEWIEAEGNYVVLHTGSTKHLIRLTMNQMEERLDPKMFMRIHRSVIVNTHSIIELRPYFNGTYTFMLKNNSKIFSSRTYRKNVEQILNKAD